MSERIQTKQSERVDSNKWFGAGQVHVLIQINSNIIFGCQTIDSHIVFLVTSHFFHHGNIFAQTANDVGVEQGNVKVRGFVFFQQAHGTLKGADDKVLAVEAITKLKVTVFLKQLVIDK
jgi:hypothetical protein